MEEYIRLSLIQLLYRALLARKTRHTYTYALTLLHYLPLSYLNGCRLLAGLEVATCNTVGPDLP